MSRGSCWRPHPEGCLAPSPSPGSWKLGTPGRTGALSEWLEVLVLLPLFAFTWMLLLAFPMCVAGAECPPSRNLAKPLASGKCLCGGNSVGYFFFTCYSEWVNGVEQSGSKAGPRRAADGEPGWHLCLAEATCSASRMEWGGIGSHGTYLGMAVPFECKSCSLLFYFFLCVLALSCWRWWGWYENCLKTVNLVQNNSINCFKLSKMHFFPHLL